MTKYKCDKTQKKPDCKYDKAQKDKTPMSEPEYIKRQNTKMT